MNFKVGQIVVYTSNDTQVIAKIDGMCINFIHLKVIKTIKAYHPRKYYNTSDTISYVDINDIRPFNYKCEKCGKKISPQNAYANDCGDVVCKECANKRKCDICEKEIIGEVYFANINIICKECYDEYYITCDSCGAIISQDTAMFFEDGVYCSEDCLPGYYDEEDYNDENDIYFDANESIATKNDDNTFGLELEVINPNKYDFKYDCDYNIRKYFNAVPDTSLSHDGVEYTTSIMKFNRKSYKIIKQFVNALKDSGAYVDESCGYHVHIGIQKLAETDFGKVKLANKILIAYLNLQNLFFEIHKDRKNSKYCMPLNKDEVYDLIKSETVVEWFKKFYKSSRPIIEKYYDKRYEWVNVHSMFYQNTVEIRLHGGTLNYKDIFYWLQINRKIIYHLAKHNLEYAKKFDAKKLHKILNKNEQAYLLKKLIGEK